MDPLIDLALLLFGAKLGGILFSKIKQPSIVGELIAGIILGPSLLALVKTSSLVTAVSDLGLLFLVLLVSLSIDWKVLEGRTEKYVWIEITRSAFTFILVYVLASMFSWNMYTFLILGFVAILSSTAIVSRTLADMKELTTTEGQMLMGLEVVDEVFAIISVALLANLFAGESITLEPIMTTIFVVVGLFVVMGRVGFKFVNRLTSSIQKYGIEEALLGFTLLLAFLLGSITESLKLASILGIFVAGMILSRSAQLPVITRKVKDIGESFFIPIFFASVGLTVNFLAAFEQIYLIVGLSVAIIGIKLISCMVSLKFFSYGTEQSLKISSGFVTASEMTVVIVSLAVSKLDPVFYVSLIASFLVINALSPMIMNFMFRNSVGFSMFSSPFRTKKKWSMSFAKSNGNSYSFSRNIRKPMRGG